METITKAVNFLSAEMNRYFPMYIDWLTLKLEGQSSFGMLSLVGFLSVFFILVYVFIRSDGNY